MTTFDPSDPAYAGFKTTCIPPVDPDVVRERDGKNIGSGRTGYSRPAERDGLIWGDPEWDGRNPEEREDDYDA